MVESVSFTDIYVDEEIIRRTKSVLQSGRYVKGPECESFESEFASVCDTEYAVGVSSGTAALLLAMKSIEIEPNDQVFVPAHTYFATVSPVLEIGAEPTFVDIDSDRYTIDPDDLEKKLQQATNPAAIVVTHMHGQPAEMDPILNLAEQHNIPVIEDAAQAHLSQYKDQPVGSIGTVGCFSFYPTKNMTVGGDGGMIVTDDGEIAVTTRALRNHGRDKSGEHTHLGLNYRLDELNAAIGREQLKLLPQWNHARRCAAEQYNRLLGEIKAIRTPEQFEDSDHVYHHYPIQVPRGERPEFRTYLNQQDIETGIHYKMAVHEHPAVRDQIGNNHASVAESLCARTVSLPMHPRITKAEIEYVCEAVEGYFR